MRVHAAVCAAVHSVHAVGGDGKRLLVWLDCHWLDGDHLDWRRFGLLWAGHHGRPEGLGLVIGGRNGEDRVDSDLLVPPDVVNQVDGLAVAPV